jgi:hypothetical protein
LRMKSVHVHGEYYSHSVRTGVVHMGIT